MAIIKTYPLKSNYYGSDKFLISDMQPDSEGNVSGDTKNITFSSLKSLIGPGAPVLTLTTANTSGAATFDVNTNTLNIPDYSVGNVDGSGTANRIPRWTDSNTLSDSQIEQNSTSIGIGTTLGTATGSLEVYNGVLNNQLFVTCPDTSQAAINFGGTSAKTKGRINYSDNADVMMFHTNSSEKMRILSNGNLGIGTTAPVAKLDILDTVNQTAIRVTNNQYNNYLIQKRRTDNSQVLGIKEFGSIGGLALVTAGSERLNVNNLGNVGIGTTSPSQKLTVAGTIMSTASSNPTLILQDATHSDITIKGDSGIFSVSNVSVGQNITMLYNGNVGIGTTSPTEKLDVNGVLRIAPTNVSATQTGIILKDPGTGSGEGLNIEFQSASDTNTAFIGSIGYDKLRIGTGGVERIRVSDAGTTLFGDGTNNGRLVFNCSANTHSVEIIGPDHSGGTSYSLKLPNSLPSVSNQILESNGAGALSWIPTPTGGGGSGGTVTSVGITMPPAFSVSNSPITGNGNISVGVTGGTAGEFLAYNGQWATPAAGTTSVTNGNPPASTGSALTISPNTGAVVVTSNTYAGTNKVGHVPAGGTASTFLRGDGTWVTPTAALDFFKTIATPTNNVIASGNSDTLTLAAGGNTGIFINGSGSQVTIGLSAPTVLDRGGVKLVNATQQPTAANGLTTTAGRTYAMQLNSSGQAVVNVPWTGGGSSGISFSGTTVGGLATFTNSSTAGVSSKVTLNANGVMQFDSDNSLGVNYSRASIDYNPTGNRMQIGDFTSNQGGIVEFYTNGTLGFQIGINGELGLGTTASQGTAGQVLTSGGNGAEPTWTAKTIVPSNVVTGAGNIYEVPMWNPQNGVSGSYIGAGGGFTSSPFKSNSSGRSIISTNVFGGITLQNGGTGGAPVTINGSTGSGGAYQINLPQVVAASTSRVLGVNSVSGSLVSTAWVDPGDLTSITGTTSVNSSTFANTPFTFANTNAGSGVGAPLATSVGGQYGNKHISFYLGTTFSGAINQSGSSTVNYATSSDYRLKENVIDMTGSVDRLKQLKPSRFNFIADGPSRTIDGFLAHEVSSIVPEAITGSKDAIDAEDNIIPQGIDQSKLVPLLVGAIKELTARIEALEA